MAEAFAEIYRRVEQSESSPSMRCWILGEVYRALDPLTLTEDQSLELLETIRRARVPADGLPKVCADWVTTLTGTPGELFSLPAKPPVAEKPNGNASVQLFEAKWKARHGGMELGMTKGEAIQIQGVAKRWPEAITQMIERFFASDDQWYVRSGHSVSAFMTRITSLRVGEPPAPPRQRHGLHVIAPGDFAKSGKLNLRTGKLEAI